jgi:copper chaperone CopZ
LARRREGKRDEVERSPVTTITYVVSDISRGDSETTISATVGALPGVDRVEVRLDSKEVAVTGRDLDDGAIHDAIHEASYGARRVIELAEPYIARSVSALGTWQHGDWRMKKYTIAYRREAARAELIEAAEAVAADTSRRRRSRRGATASDFSASTTDAARALRHVFAADSPNLDGYLDDQLDGMV